ncbi:MAG: hypothetical protein HZC10_08650 [Nitrospirae bacterium]|nr:hypothetical protein [Nitrospirota bacterium]
MLKKDRANTISINNYLTISLLFHLIIFSFAILYIRDIRDIIHQPPQDWIIADKVILIEQFGQIPAKAEQIRRNNIKSKLPSYSKPESKTSSADKKSETWGNINGGFIASVDAQFLAIKTKAFFSTIRKSAEMLVAPAVAEDAFNGSSTNVALEYGEDKKLKRVEISSESDELKAVLEKIDWYALPKPADYLLLYKGINLKIGINDSRILIGIEVI